MAAPPPGADVQPPSLESDIAGTLPPGWALACAVTGTRTRVVGPSRRGRLPLVAGPGGRHADHRASGNIACRGCSHGGATRDGRPEPLGPPGPGQQDAEVGNAG